MNPVYVSFPSALGEYVSVKDVSTEAYCYNGIQDNGEAGVDCGGSCGKNCIVVIDPPVTESETCNDGIKNQDETGTDCGGVCPDICGIGGKLNDIVEVNSNCVIGEIDMIPEGNTPFLFSGENIVNTENIKLSHGFFDIIPGEHFTNERYANLFGGLFFEQMGYQFSPNKTFKITFNFYSQFGGSDILFSKLHFAFSNDLVDMTEYEYIDIDKHSYSFSASTQTIPQVDNFYIGNLTSVVGSCASGSQWATPWQRYNEITFTIRPNDYYKQLWVFTDNNSNHWDTFTFNSLKIEEDCIFNIPYDVFIDNNTSFITPFMFMATNSITLENLNYTPPGRSVAFIAGESVILKNNIKLTPTTSASIRIYTDNTICTGSNQMLVKNISADLNEKSSIINEKIKLYPNPTVGVITIDNQSLETYTVAIYDFSGKLVKEVPKCNGTINISLSDFPQGIYAFKISSATLLSIEKVIKK